MAPGRRSGGGILGSLRRSFAPPTAAQCRRAFASGAARRPPRGSDLEAAWASLAAYDSTAAGTFLNRKAKKAKESLRGAGFERAAKFEVCNGVSMSFDNTVEVEDWDAAHLWLRESDGRGILAFRGSDSQKNLEHVRCDRVAEVYGHKLHAMGWLLTFVEAYLALAFVAHVASASFLTLKHGNADPRRSSWTRARPAWRWRIEFTARAAALRPSSPTCFEACSTTAPSFQKGTPSS